jgi:hypothetical protein
VPVIEFPVLRTGVHVEVEIWLSAPKREALFRKGQPPPPPQRLHLVLDTGADTTMINDRVLTGMLGLDVRNQTKMETASNVGVAEVCDTYDVQLILAPNAVKPWKIQPLEVLGKHLPNMDGMLGRDILNMAVFEYDGPRKTLRLTYP